MANEETSRAAEADNGNINPIITPNSSTPIPSLAQQSPNSMGFWAQIRPHLDLVSKLVPTVWSLFLFAGGLIFLTYFWSIGFMPELDVNASVTLLAVSAVTGSALFLLLAISLLFPSLVWVHMIRRCEPLKRLWSANDGEVLPRRVIPWLYGPMCGVIAGILGGLFLKFNGIGGWWSVWASFLIGLLISGGIAGYRLRRKLGNRFDQKQRRDATASFYSSFIINSTPFLVMTLAIIDPFVGSSYLAKPGISGLKPDTTVLILLTLAVFMVVLADSEIAIKLSGIKADRPNGRFFLSAVIFYLIVLLSIPKIIANSVMHIYKFGSLSNASLVLDETGCNIVQHYKLKEGSASASQNKLEEGSNSPTRKDCSLSNVVIHSRLGTAYYIEVSRDGKTPVRFTIPTQHVLSWATHDPKKPITAETPQSTQNPASTAETTQPKDNNPSKEN